MDWLIYLLGFVTIITLSAMGLGYVGGRRKHRLDMQREKRLLIEARAKELDAQNRRIELDYQSALAELEQFDRRAQPPGQPKK